MFNANFINKLSINFSKESNIFGYICIYNDNAIYAIIMSGVFMFCAAISVLYVHEEGDIQATTTKPLS